MEIFGIDKKLKSSFTFLNQSIQIQAFEKGLKDNGIDPKDLLQESKKMNQNFGIK